MKSIKFVPVKGYEGSYEISSNGDIKSLKRVRQDGRIYPEKIMKANISNTGYCSVTLYGNGITWKIAVHRLVAFHFLSNPNNLPCVNHKDGNPLNNNVSNLEWCSYSENIKHAFRELGKIAWNKGRKGRHRNHSTLGLNTGTPWNKGIQSKKDIECVCGKLFYPPKTTSRFCSKSCASKGNKRALLKNKLITI